MSFVMVTGATGLVGGAVCRDLVRRGIPVLAVGRGDARARVLDGLGLDQQSAAIEVLSGELTRPLLGLEVDRLPPISAIVHAAADTTFAGTQGGSDVNLGGTRHALEVARRAGVSSFHHVSTAFVAGRSTAWRACDLDRGQTFRNAYEASKFAAEMEIARGQWPFAVTIHRPGVVVGDALTGATPTFRGIYGLLRAAAAVVGTRRGVEVPLHVVARPEGLRHLIPVDAVARALVDRLLAPADHALHVIHHVPAAPETNASFAAKVALALGVTGFSVGSESQRPTSSELLAALGPVAEYADGEPRFATSPDGATAGVTVEILARLIEYGRRAHWRSGAVKSPAPATGRSRLAVETYVTQVLAPHRGRRLDASTTSRSGAFTVKIHEVPDRPLALEIADGTLANVQWDERGAAPAEFVVTLGAETFLSLVRARRDLRESFFAGELDISGDVERALALTDLMQTFFRRSPFLG